MSRLDALGRSHCGIVTGQQGRVLVGPHDPGGIAVRLYPIERHDEGTAT
jgi:hypothetical protein